MTEYLDLEDLIEIAQRAIDKDVVIRDYGLFESAVSRPRATVFGEDAYPDVFLKAAALMDSIARNHALVEGNRRLAWAACRTFLGVNERWIEASEDERFEFVIRVATGAEPELAGVADQLREWSR